MRNMLHGNFGIYSIMVKCFVVSYHYTTGFQSASAMLDSFGRRPVGYKKLTGEPVVHLVVVSGQEVCEEADYKEQSLLV